MNRSNKTESFLKSRLSDAHHQTRLVLWNLHDSSFLRWRLTQMSRLRRFRNRHVGEDCFIIGNGPSLNRMDLSRLKDYHTFGLNKIFLMSDKVELDLSYHVAVNPLVIEQSAGEFALLNCPSFLSYRASAGKVPFQDNFYFVYTQSLPIALSTSIEQPISEGCTVTFVAMQIAYYMGFRRVFLVGVDHNFHSSGRPHELQVMSGDDSNHFDPNYFKGLRWNLPDLDGSEVAYTSARYAFRRDDREILDATLDGKLTIFPKLTFEEALSMAAGKGDR